MELSLSGARLTHQAAGRRANRVGRPARWRQSEANLTDRLAVGPYLHCAAAHATGRWRAAAAAAAATRERPAAEMLIARLPSKPTQTRHLISSAFVSRRRVHTLRGGAERLRLVAQLEFCSLLGPMQNLMSLRLF